MPKLPSAQFVRAVELTSGVIEFDAWEKAKFVGIEQRDWNGKITKPYLIYVDCPGAEQLTFRLLVLEGQAQIPSDEEWLPMPLVFKTPRSFGTLFVSGSSHSKKKAPDRPKGDTKTRTPDLIVGLPVAN